MGDNTSFVPFLVVWLLVSLFWLFAMVPFSAAVIFPEQRPWPSARDAGTLRAMLLELNERNYPFRLVGEDSDRDLHLEWDVVDASWHELYAKVKLTTTYRARLHLYEPKKELRYHEVIKSSSFWLGFNGMKPTFNFDFSYSSGIGDVVWDGLAYGIKPGWPPQIGEVYRFHLDTIWAKRQIENVAHEAGWAFRPVIWWFEATDRGVKLGQALSPPFMRSWGRLRFWGTLYALSLVLLIVTPAAFFPSLSRDQLLTGAGVVALITLVHAAILGVWAALRRAHTRHVDRLEERESELKSRQ